MKFRRITMTWSLFMTVLILVTSFSHAWMAANRIVEQGNISMNLDYDDTTASYAVYKYDIKHGVGRNTYIDTDNEEKPLSIENVDMNPYDLIFTSRNRYTPVFARVEVKRLTSMPLRGTIFLTITRKLDNNDFTGSELSEFSSSLIRFTAFIDPNDGSVNYDNADKLYSDIDASMYTDTKSYRTEANDTSSHPYDSYSKTFVSAQKFGSEYTFTKTATITLQVDYTESNWTTVNGIETLNIFLYMTYDEGLIDMYKESSHFKIEVGTGNMVHFENDFDTIKVSYEGGQ